MRFNDETSPEQVQNLPDKRGEIKSGIRINE